MQPTTSMTKNISIVSDIAYIANVYNGVDSISKHNLTNRLPPC